MDFRPEQPMHNRYAVTHDFLSPSAGKQAVAISRIVNAFFGWEFNSCEMLVDGDEVYPIDYANACPDVAVTSLHYYFPWAITALVRWSVYCLVTGRRPNVDLETGRYFDDRRRRPLLRREARRLPRARRRALRDRALLGVVRRAPRPPRRAGAEWVSGRRLRPAAGRDRAGDVPRQEQEQFLAHFRGLIGLWVQDQARRLGVLILTGDATRARSRATATAWVSDAASKAP